MCSLLGVRVALDIDSHPRVLVEHLCDFIECLLAAGVDDDAVGCETNLGRERSCDLLVGRLLSLVLNKWVCRRVRIHLLGERGTTCSTGHLRIKGWSCDGRHRWDLAAGLALDYALELVSPDPELLVGSVVGFALLQSLTLGELSVAKALLGVGLGLGDSFLHDFLGLNGCALSFLTGLRGFSGISLSGDVVLVGEEHPAVALCEGGESARAEVDHGVLGSSLFCFLLGNFVFGPLGLGLVVFDKLLTLLPGLASLLQRGKGGTGLGEVIVKSEECIFRYDGVRS